MSSGLRWTCIQLLLQKSKLGLRDPVDMIYFMQPWMFASVLPFALWIEGMSFLYVISPHKFNLLFGNCFMSHAINTKIPLDKVL